MQIIHSKLLKNNLALRHGFTTKNVGNLAFHVDDKLENVLLNHDTLAKEFGYKKEQLVHMKQIHSSKVHIVTQKDNFNNPQECDALITNLVNIPLMVMVADCSPILFYDDVQRVIAVAHAGRQGAFLNIVANVINSFEDNFDSASKDIKVVVGAAIGSCCYEVGAEINEEAKRLRLEYAIEYRDSSYYLDIRKILKSQLLSAGILEENIEISEECPCCKSDKYFSYRAKSITGRFAGVISLV